MNFEMLPIIMRDQHLGVLEFDDIPFRPARIYWLYCLSPDSMRGSHAHKTLKQFFWAASGTVSIELRDGKVSETVHLTSNDYGLLLEPGIWRNLYNFSEDAVILVAADQKYDERDYIRNWDEYCEWLNRFE